MSGLGEHHYHFCCHPNPHGDKCPLSGSAQLEKHQWKGLCFMPCFPPIFFFKISCDRLSPGSRIKGSRIQRTLITFQRVPLAFPPEAVGVCGSSLGFETGRDEWDLIKAQCQEVWRAARGADHLHPGVGVSRGLFYLSCSYSPDKGLGGASCSPRLFFQTEDPRTMLVDEE